MRIVDLINKKKYGEKLTKEEIDFIVLGYTKGEVPDYQMSALLMAIYFQGMDKEETSNLTDAFVRSGDTVDLSAIEGIKVDKHSTGGVGDKISLIVTPLVASCGIPVAKMSGRGLGHTGGTVDKLESIEGFKIELTSEEFVQNVNAHKMAIVGQSGDLTPADKKIYALRDVTGTIDSIPLIASSIMSKKIASGADAIVLDVKVGSGAFMKSLEDARMLARTMVDIGSHLGRKTVAVITNMDQPLGHEVGNANEIREAIEVLKGNGAEDETEVAMTIASYMAVLGGAYKTVDEAHTFFDKLIQSGEAIEKLKTFVEIQGGNPDMIEHPEKLPVASKHIEVKADLEGYVSGFDAEKVGISAMMLGAGRQKKEDPIDYAAGISLKKKIGDHVNLGDVLCVLHTNAAETFEAEKMVRAAFAFSAKKPEPVKYIYEIVE
ncbi:pyrimidine-nucleoside phosphorylase [Fusibacter ferrireducens]|uniref:Pyrimidine-nucleoside phosphorylase n=1 Tax=Fusibacter ferrireducens TaxID=2785058 RepID=A0ABR9ZT60_9FIRM|nr:pyrimidine-nucleoside phosphorylase [Fusibacter ferrireducens]MBF4693669.1 pyrimidine-nucleoside phosphorylase [Fusibacter ferrireducens]